MLLFNVASFVLSQFSMWFCSKYLKKTHGRNSLGHINRGNPIHYGKSKLPLIVSSPPMEEVLPFMMRVLILFFFFQVTKCFHWDHLSSFSPGHRCSLHLLTSSPVPSHCWPVIAAPWHVLIRLSQPPSQDLEHPLQWPHWFHWPLAERNVSRSMAVALLQLF